MKTRGRGSGVKVARSTNFFDSMKVKLPAGTGICIQGPTGFIDDVVHFWNRFDCPIVWSTWETEPAASVLKIERAGIPVLLSPKPAYEGYLNTNLQSVSAFAGISHLKNLGVTHVVKTRNDCVLYGLERIWPELIGCDISFMHSYNPEVCSEEAYRLDGVLHSGLDFPLDHIVFGKTDTLLAVYDGIQPFHRPIPAEAIFLNRWLKLRGLEQNFSPEYLKSNGVVYWGPIALRVTATSLWLKNNWNMTAVLWNEPNIRIY